ncbi:uncharacterized protein LOC116251651 isoform X9 [Nymphaea colorata]|uniref:uncharacterized protein LOC116251651 isoform X9 n=1 Tax=Nymphaea colorata TaxID=210225 RepID=UPI00214E0044|nr:uncharacterized protein LOC116251651 isoform X9 [Nymphaea colorata]
MAADLALLRRKGIPVEGSAGCPSKGLCREPRPLQLPILRRGLRFPLRPPLSLPPLSPSPHPPVLFRSSLQVDPGEDCPRNLHLHLDTNKSSAVAAYDYFTQQLNTENSAEQQEKMCLINGEDAARILMLIKYIEDANLRKWELPDIRAFNIGIRPMFAKLNCVTNPYIFDQLLKLNPADLIAKGSSIIKSRQDAAKKLLGKPFKIRLGKGFYGNCLGIRADGNSNLADEIGKELSIRSAAAGLRPIGAVVYMQRGILKMCLRSTDSKADTSEIAKAYGGGGNSFSSSFTIKMDEYNKWVS